MGGGGAAATALVVTNRKLKERIGAVSYIWWYKSFVPYWVREENNLRVVFIINVCVRWTRYHSGVQIPVARSHGD
jgi:hypothetical protein